MIDHIIIDNNKITKEHFLWFLDNKDSINRTKTYKIIEILGFSDNDNIFTLNSHSRINYYVKRFSEKRQKEYDTIMSIELVHNSKRKMLEMIRDLAISEILK